MDSKVEIVFEFVAGYNRLPPIGVIYDWEQIPNLTKQRLSTALQIITDNQGDTYDWPTLRRLINTLSDDEMLYFQPGDRRELVVHHDDTRYLLIVTVNEYPQKEEKKEGVIMGWIKSMLFGKEVIHRKPEDLHHHCDAKSDLEKPVYEPSYQQAYFDQLVAAWQTVNGNVTPVEDQVDAKAAVIGDRVYLLRGTAALVPDEVLWAFLCHMWSDCVHQYSGGASIPQKTLTYSVKLCKSRGEDGIYTDPTVPLAIFTPVSNKWVERELVPHFGGNKEQHARIELDVEVGPHAMNRLTNLFALGEVLCLNERGYSGVNTLTSFGYEVVGGPQTEPGFIFTRLRKTP
jgi:hypothetical protein